MKTGENEERHLSESSFFSKTAFTQVPLFIFGPLLYVTALVEKSSMAPSVMISTLCRLIYLSTLPSVRRKLSS